MGSQLASVDLVTALQEQVGRVCAMLFNYLGALQRDAPPQPLKQELLVNPPAKSYDVAAQVEMMAQDLAAGLAELERLIHRLPPQPQLLGSGGGEAGDIEQAVALLQQNAEASLELLAELGAAAAKLAQLQDAHGALAEAALCHRAATALAAGAAAGGVAIAGTAAAEPALRGSGDGAAGT